MFSSNVRCASLNQRELEELMNICNPKLSLADAGGGTPLLVTLLLLFFFFFFRLPYKYIDIFIACKVSPRTEMENVTGAADAICVKYFEGG